MLHLSGSKRMKSSVLRVIIPDVAPTKKLYDRHEWSQSSRRR